MHKEHQVSNSSTTVPSVSKPARPPIVLTVLVVLAAVVFSMVYNNVRGPFEAKQAVKQADGTDSGAIVGTFFSRNNLPTLVWMGGGAIVLLAWGSYALKRNDQNAKSQQAGASSPQA